jgi:SMODS-associating 4TM effector domain
MNDQSRDYSIRKTNPILNKQNDKNNIRLLKASNVAYKKAKFWEILITNFLIFLSIAYPIYYVYSTNPSIKLALFGCSFFLTIFIQLFNYSFKGNTSKGALFKEEFDVTIFDLPWKTTLKKPDQADVSKYSLEYKGSEIKDWYSTILSPNISHNIAVSICQRTNTGWDIDLRKIYRSWLKGHLILYSIGLFIFFVLTKSDGQTIFLISFSILLFYTHFITLINGHTLVIEKRENISKKLDEFILSGKHFTTIELRDIQDEIYNTRQESAKVPDLFFKLYKKKMNKEFEDYIETVNRIYV